ncbi:tRNA wybutosine-synthesizing protein 5-like [Diadema antillarum]|uniref:tRNA wybutosine-synthesizing protein 5-like n=1 Tax=Diadema antillarum TaxID=105358 RepID=UPI003A8411CE
METFPDVLLFLAAVVLLAAVSCEAKVSYPKNDKLNVQFPPVVQYRRDGVIPTGHLRPFGYQKKPVSRVKEYREPLSPKHFWEDHVRTREPLVYRKAVLESPAIEKWTDEYLREKYGDLDVLVEVKKEDRTVRSKRMKISAFLDGYKTEDWYIVTVLPDEMRPDIQVPKSLLCGTFKRYIQETNFWMSSGGTASVIHYDADHNLHCLLAGRKNFIMIHPKFAKYLEMADKSSFVGSGYSTLDVDMINMFKYPDVAKVQWTWATLDPGDCIYLPAGYLHQVRAQGRSISGTILFTSQPTFDDSDCTSEGINTYTALSDVRVLWTYKKGDKVIEMGFMNPETLRDGLLAILGEDNQLTIQRFDHFYQDIIGEGEEEDTPRDLEYPVTEEVFGLFDPEGRGYVTREEIVEMDVEIFKSFARYLDLPSGPTADEMHDEL